MYNHLYKNKKICIYTYTGNQCIKGYLRNGGVWDVSPPWILSIFQILVPQMYGLRFSFFNLKQIQVIFFSKTNLNYTTLLVTILCVFLTQLE